MFARTILLTAALVIPTLAVAGGPNCDRLDDRRSGRDQEVDIQMRRGELIVEVSHHERLRIDRSDRVFVDGKELAVPTSAKGKVAEYRDGFDRVRDEAWAIGKEGGRIGVAAVTGLIGALFTTKTLDDFEQDMEARGEAIEARADQLCSVVLSLEETERELMTAVPGFPAVITAGASFDL